MVVLSSMVGTFLYGLFVVKTLKAGPLPEKCTIFMDEPTSSSAVYKMVLIISALVVETFLALLLLHLLLILHLLGRIITGLWCLAGDNRSSLSICGIPPPTQFHFSVSDGNKNR